MSGKKQHFIPRSLLRGFVFDVKTEKTYVHRRNTPSFAKSIGDVAAQRYFYSRLSSDGSKTLDDMITDYENRLAKLLADLRALPINSEAEADLAAEVIAHLTPRSANVRRIFSHGMERLMTAAAGAFADEDTVIQMLGLAEPAPNDKWNGHLSRILDKDLQVKAVFDSSPNPRELQGRLIFMAAKEHFVGSFDAWSLGFGEAFASMLDRIDDMVRDGHNKGLGQGPVAEPRKAALKLLVWHIRAAPAEGAILPDCVALGVEEEGGTFLPYMMTTMATVSAVVLPLTSETLLVGVRPGHIAPNLKDINRDAAACSDELFVTASKAPIFAELGTMIGERWTSEIDTVIQSVLTSALPNRAVEGNGSVDPLPLAPLVYQSNFIGFAEEDIAPLNNKVRHLIEQLRALLELDRLDGITFTTSFEDTLAAVERGFDTNTTPEATPDHIALGAATVLVMRGGIVKVRIVLNAAYGTSLIGDGEQDAEVALHLLVAGLAQAATLSRIEKALPGFLLKPVMMNDHDGVLHCAVRKALRAYRYARDSAEFGAGELMEQEFTKYLVGAFDSSYAVIAKAKEEHPTSQDIPALFPIVLSAASDMLIGAARVIGHRHGVGKRDFWVCFGMQ